MECRLPHRCCSTRPGGSLRGRCPRCSLVAKRSARCLSPPSLAEPFAWLLACTSRRSGTYSREGSGGAPTFADRAPLHAHSPASTCARDADDDREGNHQVPCTRTQLVVKRHSPRESVGFPNVR